MWVSRKEFDKLKESNVELNKVCIEEWDRLNNLIKHADSRVATLTKQIKCGCENFEVKDRIGAGKGFISVSWDGGKTCSPCRYYKHCPDCGWTTTYDTEEEALADKQALLDKQIGALKEQKKSLKK